jgi:hypothetical protein
MHAVINTIGAFPCGAILNYCHPANSLANNNGYRCMYVFPKCMQKRRAHPLQYTAAIALDIGDDILRCCHGKAKCITIVGTNS